MQDVPEKKFNMSYKYFSLDGKCLINCFVYQATVTEHIHFKTNPYDGLTTNHFKVC